MKIRRRPASSLHCGKVYSAGYLQTRVGDRVGTLENASLEKFGRNSEGVRGI